MTEIESTGIPCKMKGSTLCSILGRHVPLDWAGVGSAGLDWVNVPHPETESLFSHVNVGTVNCKSKFV